MPTEARRLARAPRDLAPIALALALCPLGAALTPARAVPVDRMRDLLAAERSLGLLFEPSLHRWAAARPGLLHTLDFTYVAVHLPVTLGVLLWIWWARPAAFPMARTTFVAAQTLAAITYIMLPVAPPRMVAGLGYSTAPGPGDHGIGRLVQSPFAAMPSAHTAFALITATLVFTLARSRLVRALALVYPVAVLFEIYATGNHIWLDSAGGALAAAAGYALARSRQARTAAQALEPA